MNYQIINMVFITITGNTGFFLILTGLLIITIITLIRYLIKFRKENIKYKKILRNESPLSDNMLLYGLIDNLPDFIYIKDLDSRFIIANKKLAKTVGKDSGFDLIGKTDYDYYPKHMADEFRKNDIEVMVTDSPMLFKEEKGLNEKAREIFVSTSKIPFHDENGKVIGIVGIGIDITDMVHARKELELKNQNLQEVNVLLEERQEKILQSQEELKVHFEQMLEEKNQLRTLIDNMPDRIYIKDRKSRFVIGNIHISKILKVKSPDDLIGKTDFDLHPKELAEEFYRDEQQIMSSGIALINKEERGKDMEGREVIISTTKVPIRDEYGNVIGIVGIGRDITKQKQSELQLLEHQASLREINVHLEEKQKEIIKQAAEFQKQTERLLRINHEQEKLSLVASSTDNVIIIMDAEGNFEWVNPGFIKRYGISMDKYIKEKGRNLRQNSLNENINEILDEVYNTRKPRIYNSEGKDDKGNIIWLQTTISPVLDEKGNISRLIAIDSDITQIKKAEDQINQQKQAIQKQHDELKRLNATKDKFFSIIAHDLMNPFHSIMGFCDILTKNYNEIEDALKKEYIKLIGDSSTGASALLENLLNWARTQTDQIKFEPSNFYLKDLVIQNIQMLNLYAQNKNVSITDVIPDKLIVYADYNMVNTIIRNFLTNAIKFTPNNGTIKLDSKIEDSRVSISVTDNGIGMDDETISKLFRIDELHHAPGTSGERGTGLGLIICKEFTLLHGSEISIESKKNQGSTFSFSLPVSTII